MMSSAYDIFKAQLLAAAGDRLSRRGYTLREDAIQLDSGLYRFSRSIDEAASLIDVQLLFYAGGGPSRFEVKVWRSDRPGARLKLGVWLHQQGHVTLADELGWWEFASDFDLQQSLHDAMDALEKVLPIQGDGA
jgi:hypothetical protein